MPLGLERTAARLVGDDPERRLVRRRLLGVLELAYGRLGPFEVGARPGREALELLAPTEPHGERYGIWCAGNSAGMNLHVTGRLDEAKRAYGIAYQAIQALRS